MLRSQRRTGIPRQFVPIAAAGVLAFAACDGPNAFQGPVGTGPTGRAPTVSIESPRGDSLSAKPLGDSLLVRATASDDVGLDSILFFGATLRGDVSLGTDTVVLRFSDKKVVLPGTRDTTIARFIQPTEDTVREITDVVVQAFDSEGLTSADTVALVLGGPDVQLLNLTDGQALQAGLGLNLSAIANDPQGLNRVEFVLGGVIEQTLVRNIQGGPDSVRVDTTVAIPAGVVGELTVSVSARNSLDITGADGPVTVNVVPSGEGDTIPPALDIAVSAFASLELTDSVFVTLTGGDDSQGSGIARAGYTVRAISPARGDTLVASGEEVFVPARTGTLSRTFAFPVFNVDSLSLPDTLIYEISGYFTDSDGNCTATNADSGTDFACTTLPGGEIVPLGASGFRLDRVHVAGRTVQLPAGGKVLDAVIDETRRNLFLSNVERGRVDVFRLDTEEFGTSISVGAQPIGMDLSRDGDSLWVANGGGTNFSVIDLTTEREVDNDRFFTPDVVLFDVELRESDAGIVYVIDALPDGAPGFTDRGQFMAVDSFGSIVYSTETTLLGDFGTARKAYQPLGLPQSEVKLFVEHAVLPQADNFWAMAHIDSIGTSVSTDTIIAVDTTVTPAVVDTTVVSTAAVTFFDHLPGDESVIITGDADTGLLETPTDAWLELVTAGSDAYIVEGARWSIENLGFSDTTYIARSGDRGWVLIGEGATSPVGRVLMYAAREDEEVSLSGQIPVSDFLTNSSIPIRGIGVNYDGTLAVARADQAYFFDERLRVQGQVSIPNAAAAQGATLHPLHANAPGRQNPGGQYIPDVNLAFVAGGDRTIEIIDTFKSERIGRVTIRDVITGPLKAILPFPGDNPPGRCPTIPISDRSGNPIGNAIQLYGGFFEAPIAPDGSTPDDCVVVKVFATTSAGGVVVVPIRKADILRDHPVRVGN